MATKGHRPGGGIKSRTVVHRNAPKIEPRTHAKVPAGVAQYGQMQGRHFTGGGDGGRSDSNYHGVNTNAGKGYEPPVGPTDNVAACGVGGGRTVYARGVQGTHGNVNPGKPTPGGELFPGWGSKR